MHPYTLLKTITYQSSKICYRITGEGKPVVLIHGFGEDGTIWNNQIKFLKDQVPVGETGFQLIVPDLPGSGKSDLINPQSEFSIEGHADVVKAILTEEKIVNCVMIGHSMGGYITLAFAQKYPKLVSAFGLVHSSAFADSEEKKEARLKSIAFIKKNGAHEFLKTSIPGLFNSGAFSRWPEELIEKGKNFSPEALIQYYQAMIGRPDRTNALKDFWGPILFIIGKYDTAVPFQQSLRQSYLPLQSHIHILRNSAHMGMLEETTEINNILFEFLR